MNPVLGVAFDPPVVLTVVVPGFGLNLNSKCLRAPSWILPTVNSNVKLLPGWFNETIPLLS